MISTSCTWLSRKPAPDTRMNCALVSELGERRSAGIAHGGAQTADQLVDDGGHRALVGHLPLDPLGHQLQRVPHFLLEIAVGRAARHGADRAHAAIGFVASAPDRERPRPGFRRCPPAASRSSRRRRPRRAPWRGRRRYLMPPSAITGTPLARAPRRTSMIGRELRHADAGHHAGRADRARSDADLDRIGARHRSAPRALPRSRHCRR